MARIEEAESLGWTTFGIAAAIFVAGVAFVLAKRWRVWSMWPAGCVLVGHPAVWFGAQRGDCGHFLAFLSPIWIGVMAATVALMIVVIWRRQRRAK